ncbi:hypothetical protein F140042L4_21140 [Coprococcus phoceensis]
MKDSGQLDMSWDELAMVVNKEFRGDDESQYRTEAAYRKPYQQAKRYYESGVFSKFDEEKYIKKLQLQKQELEKEKVKTRDEKNELRRIIREEARKESYKEQVLRAISEYDCNPLDYDKNKQFTGILKTDNDLIISCTDIHAGIEIDNYFNIFNEKILKERFNHYLDKIFEVQLKHGSENAYLILSELVSGIIHNELRIENNQNLIEQFLTVTNYISEFLAELSYKFNSVNVYVCPGNHSRISPKKEDSLKGENIDHLAIPFLQAKLQNFKNIVFNENKIEESIAMFNVRNNTVMASHGDKDSPNNVVQKFTLLFGIRPSLVYLGHRHTNGLTTVYNTKVIESGTLAGTDNYALNLRLHSKPSQTISVITNDGLDCLYDVKFD